MRHQLQPIADSQNRTSGVANQIWLRMRRAIIVDGGRSARENQALWIAPVNFFSRSIEGQNLAIHSGFTNAAGDQLSVLRSKVQYDDCFVRRHRQKKKTSAAL